MSFHNLSCHTMKTKSIRVCSYYFSVQTYFNILQRMDYKYFNKSHFINIYAFPRNTCLIIARLMWYKISYKTYRMMKYPYDVMT